MDRHTKAIVIWVDFEWSNISLKTIKQQYCRVRKGCPYIQTDCRQVETATDIITIGYYYDNNITYNRLDKLNVSIVLLHKQMDGWIDRWINGCMNGLMDQ